MTERIILNNDLIYFDEDTGEEFILKSDLKQFLQQFDTKSL